MWPTALASPEPAAREQAESAIQIGLAEPAPCGDALSDISLRALRSISKSPLPSAPCFLASAPCPLLLAPGLQAPAPCPLPPLPWLRAPCLLLCASCPCLPAACRLPPAACRLPPAPCCVLDAPCPVPPTPHPLLPAPCTLLLGLEGTHDACRLILEPGAGTIRLRRPLGTNVGPKRRPLSDPQNVSEMRPQKRDWPQKGGQKRIPKRRPQNGAAHYGASPPLALFFARKTVLFSGPHFDAMARQFQKRILTGRRQVENISAFAQV